MPSFIHWNHWHPDSVIYTKTSTNWEKKFISMFYNNGWFDKETIEYPDQSKLLCSTWHHYAKRENAIFVDDYTPVNRFVPCNKDGIPIIKWSNGCYNLNDANALVHSKYIGENLKGCPFIVIDIDGDHGDKINQEVIDCFWDYAYITHTLAKLINGKPVSYHLTFLVDKVIPTMHFHKACVDIIGNNSNGIRYFKDKLWNNKPPLRMDALIWKEICTKIKILNNK